MARLFAASMMPLAPSTLSVTPPVMEHEAPVAAPVVGGAGAEPKMYSSVGNELQAPLGALRMSETVAAFEHHKGYMTLQFSGVLPKFPGYRVASEFLAGASVYRVTNAEQYFFDNPSICGGKPLKYIVAKFEKLTDVEDGTSTAVNVWLLSLDDYRDFRPSTNDPCGGDTFRTVKVSESK
jgi:hypothetical protein